jgi:putative nucleotidyltransferase with HDIG domain
LLLGRPPVDLDVAVAQDPAGYARTIAERTGHRVVALGQPGQTVFRVAAPDCVVDVTTLKNARIEDDLKARDFTINAMAGDLQTRVLIDPLQGHADLAARRIRMVSTVAFANDPLRLLRAYRMAAVLDFTIEVDTRAAIKRSAGLIDQSAGERIRAELKQLLASPRAMGIVRLMAEDGLLTALFPEMQAMQGCRQSAHHDFDVFEHTLRAGAALEDFINAAEKISPALAQRYAADKALLAAGLKYAMLLHDIGKPQCRRVDPDGRVRFQGHAALSARMVADVNQRLRLSRQETQQAETIIRQHLRPLDLFAVNHRQALGPKAIHRFFRESAPWSIDILMHALGDQRGKRKIPPAQDDGFTSFIIELIHYHDQTYCPALTAPPLLNGHDLIEHFKLAPGPAIGSLLKQVEEERLAGSLTTREAALAFVRRKLKKN